MDKEKFEKKNLPISVIFILAAVFLMILPFITTFNQFLTNFLMEFKVYAAIQNLIVPYEARVVAGILRLLPLSAAPTPKGVWVGGTFLSIEWNCIGWQSIVFLAASFLTGFSGRFTNYSRFQVAIIGLLGVYLVNILRLMIVAVFAAFLNPFIAVIFHDFFVTLIVVAWFFGFWFFSYSYVLEEVEPKSDVSDIKIRNSANVSEFKANESE